MRVAVVLSLVGLLALLLPGAGLAQEGLPGLQSDRETGGSIARATGNTTLVDHRFYALGTDLYFQRRAGRQVLRGEVVDTTRDLLFAGADASTSSDLDAPTDGAGLRIYDVTDPTNISLLSAIECTGYHADVAVHENFLLHAIDVGASNHGCSERFDPNDRDREGVAGIRILDVTDPADPFVAGFVDEETLGGGVHNVSVVPDEGLAYVASSDLESQPARFAWVDLTRPDFPAEVIPMREITLNANGGCHDIGLDVVNDRAFCAALDQTHIWDISDPRAPTTVSSIVNPAINLHHGARLAPDGRTLVLNDEMGGAAAAFGCLGTDSLGGVGALWFYDISDPHNPRLRGSYSTDELDPLEPLCTSHFYNFVPGTTLLSVGWYHSGMIVVDYADPAAPTTAATFEPAGGNFWASYYYRGLLYGSSFRRDAGDEGAGGLWVVAVDGLPDRAPSRFDEGVTWSRWTGPVVRPAVEERAGVAAGTAETPDAAVASGEVGLPRTGGGGTGMGLAVLGLAVIGAVAGGLWFSRRP